MYMDNSLTSKVLDVGNFILKITFDKLITLNNMLHVADIKMNLMSRSLMNKNIFKLIFESNKLLLSKNKIFIGEEYFCDDLFKINVMTIVIMNEKKENYNAFSSYLHESCNMLHDMLGHVNYYSMQIINLDILPSMIF